MSQVKNVLVKIESTDSLSEVRIQKERFTVGRNPAADVFLSTVAVSRTHLVVTVTDGAVFVEDPGSGNGSYLGGDKLTKGKTYQVHPGDRIQLGRGPDFLSFQLEADSDTLLTKNPVEHHTVTIRTKEPQELSFESLKTMAPRPSDEKVRVEMPEQSVSIHLESDGKTPTKGRGKAHQIQPQQKTVATRAMADAPKKPYFQNPLAAIIGAAPQAPQQTTAAPQTAYQAPVPNTDGVAVRDAAPAIVRPSIDSKKSEPEHYKLLDAAHEQVRRLKAQAEAESLRLIKNAHLQAGEIRVQAEIQAEDYIVQSRSTAQEIMLQAEKDAQKTNREIQEKIFKTLQEAQADVEKLLTSARNTAQSIRKQAETDAHLIRSQTQEKVEMAIEEARDAAQAEMNELKESLIREMTGLRETAEEEASSILEQARLAERDLRAKAIADVDLLMEKAKHQAESDAEGLLEDAKALIDKETKATLASLKEKKNNLEIEIAELERNRANLDGFLHGHRAQVEQEMQSKRQEQEEQMMTRKSQLEREIDEKRMVLEKELQEQRSAFEKTMKNDQRDHEKKLESLKEEFNLQKDQIAKGIKELREKADADYKRKLQQDEKEISDIKLRMLDDAKARRDEEERRFLSLKQHFKREMSRHLEMLLVPKLKESIKSESLPVHFGALSEEIQKIVNQVLDNQNRPEGETLSSGTEKDDKELQKILRRHKMKKAFTYTAPLMVAILFVAKPQIAIKVNENLLRRPAGGSAQEQYLKNTLERREAKARFTPTLTPQWKSTYADNALSTTGYMDFKLNSSQQDLWIRELNKFFTDDMGLNENTIVTFIGMESSLLLKLKNNLETIDGSSPGEGIQRLRDFEAESVIEMKKILKSEATWQKFKKFEKEFFENHGPERKPAQKIMKVPILKSGTNT
ncbi:MAG: FHA domain-containing protein [Bdellovibrionales bacterium]|nr:FHA domain-containing protein [Bdellovibrionales bacterium]